MFCPLIKKTFGAVLVWLSLTLFASAQDTNSFESLDLELRDSLAQQDEVSRETGLRLGSFRVDPLLEVGIAHQDSESTKTLRGQLAIASQWARHSIQLDTQFETASRKGLDVLDWSIGGTLTGRRDISDRLNIAGEVNLSHQDSDEEQGQTLYGAAVTVAIAPGPFEFSLRGSMNAQHVGDAVAGSETSNDFSQAGLRLRTAYRRDALLSPFWQAELVNQKMGTVSDFDADANKWELRAGLLIDRGEKLTGEVSVGAARIQTDSAQRDELSSLVWSTSLVWSPVRLTSIALDAGGSLNFDETTNLTSTSMTSGTRQSQISLRAERSFNYRLDGFVSGSFSHENYGDIDRIDRTWSFASGFTYNLTPDSSLLGQITHERSNSTGRDQDEEDELNNGVSLRFQVRK